MPGGPAPLPPGARRFRLDPLRFRNAASWVFVRRLAIQAAIAIAILAALRSVLDWPPAFLVIMASVFGVVLALGAIGGMLRIWWTEPAILTTYEVLLGERVIQRSGAGVLPAEVLRPEVTAIFETPDALWIRCETPPRSLGVPRSLDGYDDVRAAVATWAPIAPEQGFAAWRRGWRESRRHGTRDAFLGTALATDTSLGEELAGIRAASHAGWVYPATGTRGRGARVLVLWICLIVMFLAIWQFLQPTSPPPRSRPHPRSRPLPTSAPTP
jgi:hypothetical protein